MLKININNNLNNKKKMELFRFSYFFSLIKLRNKFFITLRNKLNKFKLIKIYKKKRKINNLILKSLSYKNYRLDKANLDYFLNLKNNQDYIHFNNIIKNYKNKKEKYIPFFKNDFFNFKIFYNIYSSEGETHLKYYKKFWFFKFLLNYKKLNYKRLEEKIILYEFSNINYFIQFYKKFKNNLLIKILQCIKYYYFNYNNKINFNATVLLTYFKNLNNNYILTSNKSFYKKTKKETYYWTRFLMRKKKMKSK